MAASGFPHPLLWFGLAEGLHPLPVVASVRRKESRCRDHPHRRRHDHGVRNTRRSTQPLPGCSGIRRNTLPPSAPAPTSQTDTASTAWEKLPALIDAVVAAARENADTARSLHAFILLGVHTDQQIRKIDDTFNELGIDVGNRDR